MLILYSLKIFSGSVHSWLIVHCMKRVHGTLQKKSRAVLPHKVSALLGCSGKAVSGNVMKCHVCGVNTLSLT